MERRIIKPDSRMGERRAVFIQNIPIRKINAVPVHKHICHETYFFTGNTLYLVEGNAIVYNIDEAVKTKSSSRDYDGFVFVESQKRIGEEIVLKATDRDNAPLEIIVNSSEVWLFNLPVLLKKPVRTIDCNRLYARIPEGKYRHL